MAITDLTNTTWTFLDDIDLMYFEDYKDWNIYFYTGDTSGASIFGLYGIKLSIADSVDPNKGLVLKYKIDASPQYDIEVVDERNEIWVSDYYKLIHISGGTDVTNSDLIDFITTFAIPYNPKVKDLRNTKWYFNDTLIRAGSGWWITYTLKDNPYVEIALDSGSEGDYLSDEGGNNYYEAGVWTNQNYRYITFFEGEDDDYNDGLEDTSLIYWLELNATYLYPKPTFYRVTDLELTSIADAIRNKTGISSSLTYPNGFIDGINQLSDNTEEFLGIFNRTSSYIYNSDCTYLRSYAFASNNVIRNVEFTNCISILNSAFYMCGNLQSVSFPNCTSISNYAFYRCYSLSYAEFPKCVAIEAQAFSSCYRLSSISFPECVSIGQSAFYYCSSLTNITFPKCTSLGATAFQSCTSLTSISFPECTSIGAYAFRYCSSLTSAEFSKCTYIGSCAFQGCSNLTTALFPNCTTISSYAFSSCYSLITVSFPECVSIGSSAFISCSSLSIISLPKCQTIGSSAFCNCLSLQTIVLSECKSIHSSAFYRCYHLISVDLRNASSVPTLGGTGVFLTTPISTYSTSAGQYGSIYVPASLYDAFLSATYWSAFSARMVSV